MPAKKYFPKEFESKWVEKWESEQVYKTGEIVKDKPKAYTLSMFPYPSGSGLHVGHVRIYTGTDILARYFRMKGYSVLHPMGWDAFGLPAENAAIAAKRNPMDIVPQNIANFKSQMKALGFSYDWSKEFATTDPEYYKWTQWLFLKLYSIKNKKGERLVYRSKAPINWCPVCKTGLSNEEVLPDGTHERCKSKTVEKLLPQWMMRITDFADRLLSDLEGLEWPKGILEMQRNWIGKKEGIIINYQVSMINDQIQCFTTRPDTNFGATFIVLAPEHPFVTRIREQKVQEYVKQAKSKTKEERMKEDRKKTGEFTGFYALNNLTGKKMPIWVSDFVLMEVGTGAVIGVPGHDKRDFEFAKEFNLPIVRVVVGSDGDISPITKIEQVQEGEGTMINSDFLNGMDIHVAKQKIMDFFEKKGWGKRVVTYHLRDWIFSRQRYWGEPFPLIYCSKCGDENGVVTVPEDQLPVKLPYVESYEPTDTGQSPLSQIKEWVNVACPECGAAARRETDTMPNWAGSCWYFLYFARKTDSSGPVSSLSHKMPDKSARFVGSSSDSTVKESLTIRNWQLSIYPQKAKVKNYGKNWLPVDWYLGGAEHAVLHLLYARFWTKAFFDLGLVDFTEPFIKLRNVGMVLADDNRKMSKSLGNIINPDGIIKEYGADTLRVYEAFMAPFSAEAVWSTRAVSGAYRFLTRIWQIYHNSDYIANSENDEDKTLLAELQRVILKVSSDIPNVKFNTAIAAMMEFLNQWEERSTVILERSEAATPESHQVDSGQVVDTLSASMTKRSRKLSTNNAKKLLQLLAPFAPFITEQIWRKVFGEPQSIHLSSWPNVDKTAVKETAVNIPVQVNGKVRSVLTVSKDELDKATVVKKAIDNEKVSKYISGKKYETIYVEGKVINLIITAK